MMIKTLTDWIDKNPSPFASLGAAIMAAAVALTVLALTQYSTRRRERSHFLTGKMEELYLALNQVAERNARFFKLIVLCLHGDANAKREMANMDELDLFGHRLAKQIVMLIRLYFPRLQGIHIRLFAAQQELNELIAQLHSKNPPDRQAVVDASGKVGHFVRLMEQELIRNKDILVKDARLWTRYLKTTTREMEKKITPPDAPILMKTPSQTLKDTGA